MKPASNREGGSLLDHLRRGAEGIGANKAVLALSLGRMGDAIGNSLLFVVIPLYVADDIYGVRAGVDLRLRLDGRVFARDVRRNPTSR